MYQETVVLKLPKKEKQLHASSYYKIMFMIMNATTFAAMIFQTGGHNLESLFMCQNKFLHKILSNQSDGNYF